MMPDVLDRLTGNMWDANVVCKVRHPTPRYTCISVQFCRLCWHRSCLMSSLLFCLDFQCLGKCELNRFEDLGLVDTCRYEEEDERMMDYLLKSEGDFLANISPFQKQPGIA